MALLDVECPVGRDELTDREWLLVGALKAERARIAKKRTGENG